MRFAEKGLLSGVGLALTATTLVAGATFGARSAGSQVLGGLGDGSAELNGLHRELSTAWNADFQRAAATGRKLGTRTVKSTRPAAGARAAAANAAGAATPGEGYVYFPTADEKDTKFLVLAGSGLATLSGRPVDTELSVPRSAGQLEFGIFDGNSSGTWDFKTSETQYTLYADPQGDGSGTQIVGQWAGSAMPDAAWFNVTLPVSAAAQSPSGHFFYRLRAEATDPIHTFVNCFKLRAKGSVALKPQAFGVAGWMGNLAEAKITYPNYPDLALSTYDGAWHFHLDVPTSTRNFAVWDGDLDAGSVDRVSADMDDPDTPNGTLPSFTTAGEANPEGVAVGYNGATGNPPEDYVTPVYVRQPSVVYGVTAPDGARYDNLNPAGNQEWEQFKVSTEPFDRALMDHHANSLPKGFYDLALTGMDLTNVNAWYFLYDTVGVTAAGAPVSPLRPYLVGDTVWFDSNGNGVQDGGEAGVPGVTVALLDSNGQVVETTATDPSGQYRFEVSGLTVVDGGNGPQVVVDGTYTVRVLDGNFNGGAALAGYTSTTGGLAHTETVTTANVLTYDFGFRPAVQPASLGDRVWLDRNGDGVQNAGEPGVNGVQIQLLDASGAVVATTVSGADGAYAFTGLTPATYSVRFLAPAGYAFTGQELGGDQTLDSNVDANGNSRGVTLGSGENNPTLDAGLFQYAALGDRVWKDSNANGVQDAAETGLAGVTVKLLDANGATVATTTTDASGQYLFNNLAPGSYRVQFVTPAGYVLSPAGAGSDSAADSDALAGGTTAAVTLASGEARLTVDAGLYLLASLGDFVWSDANANGLQDSGEPGVSGVAVKLLDGTGKTVATTTTDASGKYQFTGLLPGSYTVQMTLPAGYAVSPQNQGDATRNSKLNAACCTAAITLTSGANDPNEDAGIYQLASLGNRVWFDKNGDGVQDSGETGLSGVKVQLYRNGTLVATQTTGTDGSYLFSGLAAGTYTVTVVTSTVPSGYGPTFDLDGITTVHTAAVVLAAGANRTDVDFGYDTTNNCGSYTTYTQGGWGAAPKGANPATVLQNNFGMLFPNGVTVGGKRTVTFTTFSAVNGFLPAGGTAGVLAANATNPTTTGAGVFAGQVLTLKLNVACSQAGVTRNGLGARIVATGKLSGYTVDRVLALANLVLGGETTALPSGVTVSDLNDVVTRINEDYDNGTVDRGYLR